MRTAQIARMPAVAAAKIPGSAFEDDDRGTGAPCRQRGTQTGIAAANDDYVVHSGQSAVGSRQCDPPTTGDLRTLAGEILGLVNAARALVARHLRIGAERPRTRDSSVHNLRRQNLVRRLRVLAPLLERGNGIELVRTVPAAAMSH